MGLAFPIEEEQDKSGLAFPLEEKSGLAFPIEEPRDYRLQTTAPIGFGRERERAAIDSEEDTTLEVIGKSLGQGALDVPKGILAAEKLKQRTLEESEETFKQFLPTPAGESPEERARLIAEMTGKPYVPPAPPREKVAPAKFFKDLEKSVEVADKYYTPNIKPESRGKQILSQVFSSGSSMLTTLPLGGLKLMALISGAKQAQRVSEQGASLPKTFLVGGLQTFSTWATELDPTRTLLKPGITFFNRLGRGLLTDAIGEEIDNVATEMWLIDEKIMGGKHSKEEYKRAFWDTLAVSGVFTGGATTLTHPGVKQQEALVNAIEARKRGAQEFVASLEDAAPTTKPFPVDEEAISKLPLAERSVGEIQDDIDATKDVMLKKALTNQPAEQEAEALKGLEREMATLKEKVTELPPTEQVLEEHKAVLKEKEDRLGIVNKRISKLKESPEAIKEEGSLNREKRLLEKQVESQKKIVESVEEIIEPTEEPESGLAFPIEEPVKKTGLALPLEEDKDIPTGGLPSKTGFITPTDEKPLIEMPELVELTREINEGKYPIIRENMGKKYGLHKSTGGALGEADIFLKADIFTGDLIGGITVKRQEAATAFVDFKESFMEDLDPESGITEDALVFKKDFNKRTGKVDIKVYRKNPQLAAGVTAHEIGHHIDYLDDKDLKRGNILGRLKSLKRYMISTIDALPADPSKVLTKKDRGQMRRDAMRAAGPRPKDKTSPEYKVWLKDVNGKNAVLINNEILSRGLITRDEIMQELRNVSQARAPFNPQDDPTYTKYRNSSVELYADAISAFVNTPDMFKQMAPKFRKSFLAYMENKPQVKSAYDSIINRIGKGRDEVVDKRIENIYGMIGEGNVARQDLNERNRQNEEGVYDTLMNGLIDSEHSKLKPIRKQELQGGEIGKAAREARYDIEEIPYISSEAENYYYRVNQLVDQAKEINITKDDIGAYGFSKRIPSERENIANPLGFSAEDSIEALEGLRRQWGQEKFGAVDGIVQEYRKIREELIIPQVEESGYYSPETVELVKENTDYMKFSIYKHLEETVGSGVAAKIHKQVGTLSGTENPFIATVMQDMSIMRAITINNSKQSMVDVLGVADQIEPADMRWSKDVGARVPIKPKDSKKALLTVMVDGKPQHHYVSKVIADSYEHAPFEAKQIARIWNTLNAPIRAILVSKNPLWMARNVVKDLRATIKNNPEVRLRDVPKLLQDYRAAFGEAWKDVMSDEKSADIQALLKGKALLSDRAYSTREKTFDDELDRLADRFSIVSATEAKGARAKLKKAWDLLDKMGKVSERTGKVAGYKYLKNRTDLSEREIAHRVRTRIGTPDVKRKGSLQWFTNNVFMFSNVNKEGVRASYESYKADPSAYIWKTIAMNMLPKLALAGFTAAVFRSDDDDMKKLVSNISEYDMKNYTSIPLFLTEDDKTVYLRIPEDYQGQLFGGLVWDAAHGRFAGKDGVLSTLGDAQPYQLNPLLGVAGDLYNYYIQGNNPQDEFRGRPVIPDLAYQTGGAEANKAMAKHVWSSLGGNAIYRPSYNINRDKSSIDKILSVPPFNVLGQFVRISDRGVSEKYYKTLEEARKDQAEKSLASQRVIVNGVNDGKDNDTIEDNLEKLDLINNRSVSRIKKYRALKVDSPEVNAYAMARSNAERIALEKEFRKVMTAPEVDAIIDKYHEWISDNEKE